MPLNKETKQREREREREREPHTHTHIHMLYSSYSTIGLCYMYMLNIICMGITEEVPGRDWLHFTEH